MYRDLYICTVVYIYTITSVQWCTDINRCIYVSVHHCTDALYLYTTV